MLTTYTPVATKWCDEKKDEFQSKFDPHYIIEVNQLLDALEPSNNINQMDLDNITKKLDLNRVNSISNGHFHLT